MRQEKSADLPALKLPGEEKEQEVLEEWRVNLVSPAAAPQLPPMPDSPSAHSYSGTLPSGWDRFVDPKTNIPCYVEQSSGY